MSQRNVDESSRMISCNSSREIASSLDHICKDMGASFQIVKENLSSRNFTIIRNDGGDLQESLN